MSDDPTDGLPYSHVYLRPGRPQSDSKTARIRLAAYAESNVPYGSVRHPNTSLFVFFQLHFGIELPVQYAEPLGQLFRADELSHVLDAVTVVTLWLRRHDSRSAEKWAAFVKQVFEEEHLGYRLDSQGGVRLLVDEHYERNRTSTVSLLGQSRYGAVRDEFENCDKFLTEGHTREAVAALFVAVEILSKLMTNGAISLLGVTEVNKKIRPLVELAYDNDVVARTSAGQLLTGLCDWINSAQPYRHGQHIKEPADPPMSLTVALISIGTSYLRWLVEVDQAQRSQDK
jgi:hypothetical protein